MKLKKSFVLSLCLMLVAVSIMACTPARRPITENPDNQRLGQGDYNGINGDGPNGSRFNGNALNGTGLNGNGMNGDNLYPNREMDMTMGNQMEEKIKNDVEKIDGVNNAVVLMNENTAYIGIDAKGNISDNKMNDLKDQVIERARKSNNEISRVYVSADVDVMDRLRGYGTQVRAGKPITGFINEIEEMFRRPLPKS